MGRRKNEIPVSRINELSQAIWGDFGLLRAGDGAGLDDEGRRAWAKGRLIELIDEEVAALRNCFEGLDHEAFELDREEAPKRALFDASKPAVLARRYEAANERGMFRALREMRQVEREASANPPISQDRPIEPLGSFFQAGEALPEPDEVPGDEREYRPSDGLNPRSPLLLHPVRVENWEKMGVPVVREVGAPGLSSVN